MKQWQTAKAFAIGVIIISALVSALFALSYLLSNLLGLPPALDLPAPVRAVGGVVVVAGLATVAWVFVYRKPAEMMVSTYFTFAKMFGIIPIAEAGGRIERLVIVGPQRYVRNPLYLGVVVMTLGWAILGGYTFVFIATLMLLLWFGLVLIPFEERELRALFGDQWRRYSDETPMLFPFTKRGKRPTPTVAY